MPKARWARALGVALWACALGAAQAADRQGCLVFPDVPAVTATPRSETIDGRAVLRVTPLHPKGVVYMFHGTGGSERFALRLQTRRALAPLVAAGYAWVAAPSLDRTDTLRWNVDDASPASNPDIAYMLRLHAALVARGEITTQTPVFTMGMSNGGAFANLFGLVARRQGLPVAAVADYMGPFRPAAPFLAEPAKLPPTLLVLSRNDGYVAPDPVITFAAALARVGARVETHLDVERAVCAATFAVLPGLSATDRETLVSQTLPATGVIDAQGRRAVFTNDPVITREDMATLRGKLDGLTLAAGLRGRDVADVLLVAWAAHEMRSDLADRQLAFFDAAIPKGP